MALDPSIPLQVRSYEPPNMLAQYAQIAGIQNAGMQNKLAQVQYDNALRAQQDDVDTREAFKTAGSDRTAAINALLQRGQYKPALVLEEAERKRKLEQLGMDEKSLTIAVKKGEALSGIVAPLLSKPNLSHEDVLEAGRRAQAMGIVEQGWEAKVPMNALDLPNFVRNIAASTKQGIDALKALAPDVKMTDVGGSIVPTNTNTLAGPVGPMAGVAPIAKTNTPDAILTDQRTRSEGAANRGVTLRGQNLTDARARELATLQREATASGRVPAGYRFKADGVTLEPIPGGPAEATKMTEAQGKAGLYSARALEADNILKPLEEKISVTGLAAKRGMENIPGIGGVAGAAGNVLLSADQQKVEQAQRNFVNAILRQESGAVISPSEFDNAQKQYFPQPGDSKEVIEQKRKNRGTAISGLKVMAGPAAPKAGASGEWKIEEVK